MVQLARGDQVAAEKAFKEWGNCCDPQEVQTLEALLQAYDDGDPDMAVEALSSPFIRHMDVEYALLAREIPLPQGLLTTPKAAVIKNATASYTSPNVDVGVRCYDFCSLLFFFIIYIQTINDNQDEIKPSVEENDEEDGGLC